MIKKIKITKAHKTVPKDFELELGQMTVITGENNSGKTNFIQAVQNAAEFFDEKGQKVTPNFVYIPAENINPADSELKHSAKTTGLVENLSKLFAILDIKFELQNKPEAIKQIQELIDVANQNLSGFAGHEKHKLQIDFNQNELSADVIIQALISKIAGSENGIPRKLDDLGQGTQRIIVASILKAYSDILVAKKITSGVPTLILFEEPEIYLHPKLKRTLNATLEKIAEQYGHQIIVTTHDPYFALKAYGVSGKNIFSFKSEAGVTEMSAKDVIAGIEDELLFIFLYSSSERAKKKPDTIDIPGFKKRNYFSPGNTKGKAVADLKYIRDQIHHLGGNSCTLGMVVAQPSGVVGMNYYTQEELASAIQKLTELLAGK